jgi:acetylornithine deacetylase/succinyl-diaminopimelate desuccinylase-like protein
MRNRILIACLATSCVCRAAEPPSIDWGRASKEALEHFSALVRIDTSNPPGNESRAAAYLQDALEKEHIQARLFALEPGRDNLVARIQGNGSKRPILIMGHTDVVGVQRERWSVDPFAAVSRDDYIYGRGTLDDKDNVTAALMVMLLLNRSDIALDRDVIFLAEAGEEGTPRVGIDYMVSQHWNEIDAEYCLAEGGTTVSRDGKVRYVSIATTEKFPMRVRLLAHGTAGHGSIPRLDNPISALAEAVSRLSRWQPPMRLNETTRTYFQRLAAISEPDAAFRYTHLTDAEERPRIERYFAEHEPEHYSILRTSVVPTIIDGGFRRNVIPSEAEATLDIRAVPDQNPQAFYADLAGIVNNPNVEVIPAPLYRPPGPPSSIDSEMFHALESATEDLFAGAVTLPAMLTGATDMAEVRAKGTQCYGFGPVVAEEQAAEGGGAHGDDERIKADSVPMLVRFLWDAVTRVAAH